MLACLTSAALVGVDARPVHVEVDVSYGLPSFSMVGLPDTTVRESRDRVRSAIRNSGFEFPPHRVTINLAPADLRKAGSSFDLPIALGLLATAGVLTRRAITDTVVLGELSLDGGINPVRGALPAAAAACRDGIPHVLLPPQNAAEATAVGGLRVLVARTLREAVAALNDPDAAASFIAPAGPPPEGDPDPDDLTDVRGQPLARRALEIAAAGAHHLLLIGPPGSGKTLLARRLGGLLPPLTAEEAIETTTVHSVAGLLPDGSGLVRRRPFRAPHHTVSTAAMVGGGAPPRPGEVSLAHHGVLFLDEAPEFDRRTLEVLRQPLEDGTVRIVRVAGAVTFPARFMLVVAMNPCPCGFAGDPRRRCRCTPEQVRRYQARLSGPLVDRLDLAVELVAVPSTLLDGPPVGDSSAAVAARVAAARARQAARFALTGARNNAGLRGRDVRLACRADAAATGLLHRAAQRLGLTARGYHRVLRVARTIADLAGDAAVGRAHVAEALQYRHLSRGSGAETDVRSCQPDVSSSAPRPPASPP